MSISGRPQNDKKAKVHISVCESVLKNKMRILFLCYFEIHLTGYR